MRDVGAVVVHHRHFPEVVTTVEGILAAGVPAGSLVVVDNSEDAAIASALAEAVPDGVRVLVVPNHGYGAAVNAGATALDEGAPEVVIVSTHEVRPDPGALGLLVDALRDDPSTGVAGPTLVLAPEGDEPPRTWSLGGRVTRVLGWPQHVQEARESEPTPRDWLDGALCVYRAEALRASLREDFFMYVEEMEFHRRLRSLGWGVVWVPGARATQATHGAPPFLQARNLQMFYAAWGTPLQRYLSVPLLVLRQLGVRLVRRQRPWPATVTALRGWRAGVRAGRSVDHRAVRSADLPLAFHRH